MLVKLEVKEKMETKYKFVQQVNKKDVHIFNLYKEIKKKQRKLQFILQLKFSFEFF